MKQIVIVGGGFAGVSSLVELQNRRSIDLKITLIDKNAYHSFTPSLYEVATSEEPKKNIAIPFTEICSENIHVLKGEVSSIDHDKKVIVLGAKQIPYDYVLLAVGSEAAYCAIPGLSSYAIPLKTVSDALRIKNTIREKFHMALEQKKQMTILVGGGGFSGIELAAELAEYKKRLIQHHKVAKDMMMVHILQGSDRLLKELDQNESSLAAKRLVTGDITFSIGEHITHADAECVTTDAGKKYSYNVLIWTGGVEGNHIAKKSRLPIVGKNQVPVNSFLQVKGYKDVFAAGDIACFEDPKTKTCVPLLAYVAADEGRNAAKNMIHSIRNEPLEPYEYHEVGFVVPIRGKYAIASLYRIHIAGFFGWVIQQVIFLRYLVSVLSIFKALKRWNKFEMYLMKE